MDKYQKSSRKLCGWFILFFIRSTRIAVVAVVVAPSEITDVVYSILIEFNWSEHNFNAISNGFNGFSSRPRIVYYKIAAMLDMLFDKN